MHHALGVGNRLHWVDHDSRWGQISSWPLHSAAIVLEISICSPAEGFLRGYNPLSTNIIMDRKPFTQYWILFLQSEKNDGGWDWWMFVQPSLVSRWWLCSNNFRVGIEFREQMRGDIVGSHRGRNEPWKKEGKEEETTTHCHMHVDHHWAELRWRRHGCPSLHPQISSSLTQKHRRLASHTDKMQITTAH